MVAPSFDIVRVTPGGQAVLAGHAAPDSTVAISAGGKVLAQAHADADGQWAAAPNAALPAGPSELTLAAQVGTTLAPVAGSAPLLVIVPEAVRPTAPAAPVAGVARRAEPAVVAMLLPGNAPPQVLQKPGVEATRPAAPGGVVTALNLDQVDYPTGGAIRFAGSAHPNAVVRLYVDDRVVGEARADTLGRWSMTPIAAIALGPHRIRVDEIGIRGQVVARIALPFERSELSADEVLAGRVVVQPHQTLWRIARRAYGQGIRYTVIYQANREQISDPARIYPGQIFMVPGLGRAAAPP